MVGSLSSEERITQLIQQKLRSLVLKGFIKLENQEINPTKSLKAKVEVLEH